jgi:hypothetical protein
MQLLTRANKYHGLYLLLVLSAIQPALEALPSVQAQKAIPAAYRG